MVELTEADGEMQIGLMQSQLDKIIEQIDLQKTGLEIDQKILDKVGILAEGVINSNPLANGVTVAAKGLHAFADKPTLILAGEAGREHIDITPIDQLRQLSSLVAVGDGRGFGAPIFNQLRSLSAIADNPRFNSSRNQNNGRSEGTRPVVVNFHNTINIDGSNKNSSQTAKEIEDALMGHLKRGPVLSKLQQVIRLTN